MRKTALALSLSLAAAAAVAVPAALRAEDPPPNAPKPPDTPLPKAENPLSDAEVGETCFFAVKDPEGKRPVSYFEETVLARSGEEVLVEVVSTDATDAKNYGVDATSSGWRPAAKDFPATLGPTQSWRKDLQRDEIVYVGAEGAIKAVRCTRRGIEEPESASDAEGRKRVRMIWFSHDVKGRGIAKMFPAPRGGERRAISWDKKVPADVCKERAVRYGNPPEEKPPSEPGPGMDEPGMADPGMTEPGMTEPGMTEPGMTEPGMDGK